MLLHVAIQFSSSFLFSFLVVEEAFFFLLYILASLSVAGWPWVLGLSLGFLSCYLVPLICVFVFVPVPFWVFCSVFLKKTFTFFGHALWLLGSYFPDQLLNPRPWQ